MSVSAVIIVKAFYNPPAITMTGEFRASRTHNVNTTALGQIQLQLLAIVLLIQQLRLQLHNRTVISYN